MGGRERGEGREGKGKKEGEGGEGGREREEREVGRRRRRWRCGVLVTMYSTCIKSTILCPPYPIHVHPSLTH